MTSVPGGFLPDEDQGYFFMNASLPDGASLDRTRAVTDKINKILLETEGVAKFLTVGGYSLLAFEIVEEIRTVLQRPVTLQMFFDKPTVAELAAVIDTLTPAVATEPDAAGRDRGFI